MWERVKFPRQQIRIKGSNEKFKHITLRNTGKFPNEKEMLNMQTNLKFSKINKFEVGKKICASKSIHPRCVVSAAYHNKTT